MSDGATYARLPAHLRKYVVDQNYARYTAEDQATWRFIMRQLREYLKDHAHPTYLEGLSKTGITTDQIPRIAEVDRRLNDYGWGAVPVSGFIPPAAFMELQSLGVLPVASDMRTLEHWLYTPAPDIIHEAAGHAPLLIHPEYSNYLRHYGEVARHTIIAQEDLDQYEAIRTLSDLKEDPRSTPEQVAAAERRFAEASQAMTTPSEATLLSRMNWWTAEYGLIGSLENPRLFGAGLLSSVGEARTCLEARVKKIPLSVDCVNYAYDITELQPHLFVTPDFATLNTVLDELADRLSYRRGGAYGLTQAQTARTVNTVVLDSGVQISGRLESYLTDRDAPAYLRFAGPCQLSVDYQQLRDQGVTRHAHRIFVPGRAVSQRSRAGRGEPWPASRIRIRRRRRGPGETRRARRRPASALRDVDRVHRHPRERAFVRARLGRVRHGDRHRSHLGLRRTGRPRRLRRGRGLRE